MKFHYQARTKTGQVQSGIIEAASREAAIALLQRHKLYVTFLEQTGAPPIWARKIKIFERISRKDRVLFSRQLSILFKTKVPLVEALRTLSIQTKNPSLKEIIEKLADDVEGGTTFSTALSKHPKVFSPFYISMVKSGEVSGTLSESLSYLADYLEREYHLYGRIKGALTYPIMIFIVMIFILSLMIFFVLPQLISLLEQTGQELPLITKIVIAFCDFAKKWGLISIVGFMGLATLSFRYLKTAQGKKIFDKFLLKIPIIGSFAKLVYLSRFAESLSTLIAGGLPIVKALEISGEVVGNDIYKTIIFETRERVRRGEPISQGLKNYPDLFPPIFAQMTTIGEKTGTLDQTLRQIVDFYQKEVERGIEGLLSILEPVMIMFLGGLVGLLVGSILLPLYQAMTF